MIELDRILYRIAGMEMSFTLSVAPATFAAVIGPSGGGKSTLLELIAGFLSPAHGAMRLAGADMAGVPPARRPVSLVFQDHKLLYDRSAFDNVMLPLAITATRLQASASAGASTMIRRFQLVGSTWR